MAIDSEFKFFGQNMERISIIYGCMLVAWAIFVSLISQSGSITSMIPAFFGLPITLLGFMAIKRPEKQKLFMHIVVMLGLLVCLGGLDFFRSFVSEAGAFANPWAGFSKLFMLITGGGLCFLCIKSFIHARKFREIDLSVETLDS